MTLDDFLKLCPDEQQVMVFVDDGHITGDVCNMRFYLIAELRESKVSQVEAENSVLKVWVV